MKGKNKDILLTVLSILTILVAVIGVTFSFFTTRMNGNAGSVGFGTMKVGNITFDGGNDFDNNTDIVPGYVGTKKFTISVPARDVSNTVYIRLDYTNTFSDLEWSITGSGAKTSVITGKVPTSSLDSDGNPISKSVVVVEKTISASNSAQTFEYTMTISLPNKDSLQNYDQGKKFNGTLYADLGGDGDTIYYNTKNPEGTKTEPTS